VLVRLAVVVLVQHLAYLALQLHTLAEAVEVTQMALVELLEVGAQVAVEQVA
jgi:hypothetical protein